MASADETTAEEGSRVAVRGIQGVHVTWSRDAGLLDACTMGGPAMTRQC
jgi:hypothetical protein